MSQPPSTTESILEHIATPADVKALPAEKLPRLAQEIRDRMVSTVSHTGGHLAPSLGTIELTLALCRVFDFPQDKLVWDVGHQAYAWKMLTGRLAQFDTLRQFNGLRGFPHPAESPYDAFVGGHAGVALSAALGMAAARDERQGSEHCIAVVGDASLTNGISLEALNAIRHTTERMILVINDNGMSISRNVGAFSRIFAKRLAGLRYNRIRAIAEQAGHKLNLTGLKMFYRRVKSVLKPLLLRNRAAIFEDLGIRYIGPIDGHDINALEQALHAAAEGHVPVALHIATVKGRGYTPAEVNPSKWHGVSPWATTHPARPKQQSWSEAFGECVCNLAIRHPELVAITAAMRDGTGLANYFRRFPTRAYDVGICEGHAVSFAAGLAAAGKRPIVALYSTFAQRAIDNLMHDICLQKLPVVLCLDRAGIVGSDGPTHHGLYDIALVRCFPGVTFVAPCDRKGLERALQEALTRDGPTVIRYPRGPLPKREVTVWDGTPPPGDRPVLLALGNTATRLDSLAETLPIDILAIDRIKPLPEGIEALAGRTVITLEDAALAGGFGSAIAEIHRGPLLRLGWPDTYIPQGSDAELCTAYNLNAVQIATQIRDFIATASEACHG